MFDALRNDWRRVKRGVPGRRFQDVYEVRQKRKKQGWSRAFWLALGGVLVVLGPIAGLVPGPGGIVVLLLGLALLARELRPAAQALDWCEQKLRKGWNPARKRWSQSTPVTRFAFVLLGLAVVGGFGYLGYFWLASDS